MPITVHNLFENLPESPALAMLMIIERVEQVNREEVLSDDDLHVAVTGIVKYAERKNIRLKSPDSGNWPYRFGFYARQVRELAIAATLDRLEEEEPQQFLAHLVAEEKTQILTKLEEIRKLIDGSDLPGKKKNALFRKLNKFAAEVMRDGTSTDALFAFSGELSLHLGLMAKNAKPAIDELKDILRIVLRVRAKSEGLPLPSPEDFVRLPGPKSDE